MWFVLAALVFFASCQTATDKSVNHFYFDTKDYFDKEKIDLFKAIGKSNKLLELNHKKEEINELGIDTQQLKSYINIFEAANINKTIYKDEYKLDTFWILDPITHENIEVLDYISLDSTNDVQWLQVYSNGNLKAAIQSNNFLFKNYKEVYYEKNKAFSLFTIQKTLGLDTVQTYTSLEF